MCETWKATKQQLLGFGPQVPTMSCLELSCRVRDFRFPQHFISRRLCAPTIQKLCISSVYRWNTDLIPTVSWGQMICNITAQARNLAPIVWFLDTCTSIFQHTVASMISIMSPCGGLGYCYWPAPAEGREQLYILWVRDPNLVKNLL